MDKLANKDASTFNMAVWVKESDSLNVHELNRGILPYINPFVSMLNNRLALEGLLGLGSFVLPYKPFFKKADIVHLQLINTNHFFSILALPKLNRCKPLVWTIHDCWPTTGMCIYSFECQKWLSGCSGMCPYPRGKSILRHFTPAFHWMIKKKVYKSLDIELIAASKWIQDRVQKSPLLKHLPCHLIPFGIDLNTFYPKDKKLSRSKLGIDHEGKIIAFRGTRLKNGQFKGTKWLLEALQKYTPNEPTSLVILEDGRDFESLSSKYNIINLGWIDNDKKISDILSAADIFLMPSIQEAFGLMAIEALACGTPVVVFKGTALPDVIKAPYGGIAVPSKNSTALAKAIKTLLDDDDLRKNIGKNGRKIAVEEYSLKLYMERHMRLYTSILSKRSELKSSTITIRE